MPEGLLQEAHPDFPGSFPPWACQGTSFVSLHSDICTLFSLWLLPHPQNQAPGQMCHHSWTPTHDEMEILLETPTLLLPTADGRTTSLSRDTRPGLWGCQAMTESPKTLTSGSWWRSRRCAPCQKSCGGSACSSGSALPGTGRTSPSPSSVSPSPLRSGCPAVLDEARAPLKEDTGRGLRSSGTLGPRRTVFSWRVRCLSQASYREGTSQAEVQSPPPSPGLSLGVDSDLRGTHLRRSQCP